MLTLSAIEVVLSLVNALICLLIISIWIRQAKEGRQHYPLSFTFIWLLLVALLTFLSQFLLEPSSFNPPLLKLSGLENSNSPTYIIDTSNTPLSGLTAISNAKLTSNGSSTPKDANNATPKNLSQLQICVLFAHFEQVLWLGVSMSLLRYTWYLYRSLRRKLGVVSPRLMEAVAEHDPAARGTRFYSGGVGSDMAAGFSFTRRSIRSFSDVWGMMPVFIVVPVAIVGLVIKTCLRSVLCCYCMSSHNNDKTPISDQNRAVKEEEILRKMKAKNVEDVFEAWPKWPKYMEDDPSVNHPEIGPSDHQLTEIRVHSPDVVSSLSHPTTAASMVSEHPTLATKLRVSHFDLNDTHEESYGYDITKQRIRYHRDSWSHKTRVMMAVHQQLIGDIFVCIVIPALAFVPLYAVPAQGRAYDVYPDRGGCRISSSGGSGDWIRTVVLLTLNTVIAVLGLLLAILSILQFKKQNGALSFKMKSLTPSPAVLRLYKSTEIVKNILLFCVGLNTILALGRIIHLGLAVSSTNLSTSSNPPKPLFRLAEHDQDVLLVLLAIILVVVTYLKTFWASLRKTWRRLFYCFRNAPSEEDDDNSAHISSATFPNYPKPLEKGKLHPQRSITLNRYLTQTTSTTTTSTTRASADPDDNEMTRLERSPGSRIGIVEPSMIISFGSERRVMDLNEDLEGEFVPLSGSLNSRHVSFSTKADSCSISIEGPSKPEQAAQVSDGRSTTDSSSIWLSSAPINADGALTAIPSTSTSCTSFSPTLVTTSTTSTFVPCPLPVATLSSKIPKSTLRSFSCPELLAYTQGPLPRIPDQRFSAARVKGRLQSHSIASQSSSPPCSPSFSRAQSRVAGPEEVGTTSTATGVRDNQKMPMAAIGKSRDPTQTATATTKSFRGSRGDSQHAFPSIGRCILQNQGSYPTSVSICTPQSSSSSPAFPLRLLDMDTLPLILASSGDNQPTTASATAVTAIDLDFDYDCNLDEDDYDMETMGAISLEELIFDEPSTDYDTIHQIRTTLPSDNRAVLESIVHHAFMSSAPPPMIPFSHRTSSSRRSTSRSRGRRRPSVIQHSNSPYYGHGHGHISRASSGRSSGRRSEDTRYPHHRPLPLRGAYFHLVSRGINVVDLYGDTDDDDETPGFGTEFMTATATRPRGNHHRKKSSLVTLYNVPFQPHTPHSYMLQRFSVKGKCSVGGGYVGGSTVLENGPPRPDSPTDPQDP